MSRFRRRLMGLAALRQAAADDFVRVEYIESTGTQWIDTGYKINNVDSFEIIIVTNGIQEYMGSNGNLQVDLSVSKNLGKRTIKVTHSANNGPKTYVNGSLVKSQNFHKYNGYIIALFAMGISSSAVGYYSSAAVYSAQLIINNTLVRDYIPVLNKATNEYGMYDLVQQKFYTSPNGAKFVGGREIIYDAEIEYLESTGTQYIQLDCNVTKTNKFSVGGVVIPIYTSDRGDYAVFGANPWTQFIGAFYSKNNNNVITYSSVIGGLGAAGGVGGGWGGTVGTEVSFELSTTEKVINGVHTSISRPLQNAITAFRIFGGYRDNHRYPIKIKSLYIKKENEILYDFIPVRVGNVGYLYDKVSNKLFGNNGSGSFILGQDTVVYDKI